MRMNLVMAAAMKVMRVVIHLIAAMMVIALLIHIIPMKITIGGGDSQSIPVIKRRIRTLDGKLEIEI